jgi:TrmH family RNA methyltransferase
MLSKAQSKHIRSLTQQKFRKEHHQFIAEGHKVALEYLNSTASIATIVATNDWVHENIKAISKHPGAQLMLAEQHEIDNISALQTPGPVLVVVSYPKETALMAQKHWYLALDDIQDPGNMGTLIRIADWFGVQEIVCSAGCVDIYNPKVIQAAMGSHLRVRVHTAILTDALPTLGVPIYAATLQGTNIYQIQPEPADAGVIVIGNESKGISQAVTNIATHQITIPRLGGAESLNAGVSAGIICALLIGEGANP